MSMKAAIPSDGYEASGIVRIAVQALIVFGGDLNRTQASRLLPMWYQYGDLTDGERSAVLARFPGLGLGNAAPAVTVEGPGNSGPGW